jgi:hypothetical protein
MRGNLRTGWSALRNSIIANSPYYPPPIESTLDPRNIVGTSVLATMNPPVVSRSDHRSGIVSRRNRKNGMRELYSRGAQRNGIMHMIATGRVESSRFQQFMAWTWGASFNDALYEAGYPQNLGLSFKAPSVPDGVATSAQWGRMRPSPQIVRTVFTRRNFSGAPSVPAQPQSR